MSVRYVVHEVEVSRNMERFEFPFRIFDTETKTYAKSSFRTFDGCQAMCDYKNGELTKASPVIK